MHFLVGWPAAIQLPPLPPLAHSQQQQPIGHGADGSPPLPPSVSAITETIRSFAHNHERTHMAVVTDTAVYLFHFQQCECMCVGVWRRSAESLASEGNNGCALFSAHGEWLAVATTRHVLNVLRIRHVAHPSTGGAGAGAVVAAAAAALTGTNSASARSAEVCSFPNAAWHDENTLAAPTFHPVHLQLHSRIKIANDFITCACSFGDAMVLGTRGGYIQVVGWDGAAQICVDALAWANSASATAAVEDSPASPAPAASPFGAVAVAAVEPSSEPSTPQLAPKPSIVQVTTSSALGLVAFVFSDGSAGVCDTSLLRPAAGGQAAMAAAAAGSGMLLMRGGLNGDEHATRVSFNCRYRMLAVGVESGDVLVYRVESSDPASAAHSAAPPPLRLTFLRRYSIGPWGFTAHDVGAAQCMEWSPDGSVLAVGWATRGLVVWSTGGTRVACTLPMLAPLGTAHTSATAACASSRPNGANGTGGAHPPPSHAHTHSSVAPSSELLGHGVAALAWGCAGASLLVSGRCNEAAHGFGSAKPKSTLWNDASDEHAHAHPSPTSFPLHAPPPSAAEVRCGCGLFTRLTFVRSCLGSNPSQSEQTSLALLGEDRIVLWAGKRSVAHSGSAAAAASSGMSSDRGGDELGDDLNANWVPVQSVSNEDADAHRSIAAARHSRRQANQDRFLDSDGDWEHIQLPVTYLSHSWPLHYCAISSSGFQIACAGAQGLILYNRAPAFASFSTGTSVAMAPQQRKWRRFGNQIHEAAVHAAGLAWYGEHVVCIASRGQQAVHNIPGRTSHWSPPPAAAAKRSTPASANIAADSIELLFYPRSHLDNASLLHTHVLSNATSFHSLDISGHTLMVYLSVGQLLIYRLHAEVHVHADSMRKHAASPQAAIAMQLAMAMGGIKAAPPVATPYSTAPHAHDSLGADHEIRMSMELSYVVDLCAPLAPVRSLWPRSAAPHMDYESASLLSALSTPPLQCRLWLTSADSLERADEYDPTTQQHESVPVETASAASVSSDSPLAAQQVYEVPLFCPNAQPQGLEALFQATTPNPTSHVRRLSRGGGGGASMQTPIPASQAKSGPARKTTKVLSCILLTATGTLLAVDIGSTVRTHDATPSTTPLVASSTPPQTPFAPHTPHAAAAPPSPTMVAWVRAVANNVEQFWLHDMAAADPMRAALQFLQSQRKGTSSATASPAAMTSQLRRSVVGSRLFTYSATGLDVWFRLPSPASSALAAPPPFQSSNLAEFDAEVYPLGLDSAIGAVVGITKGLRTRSAHSGMLHTPHGRDRRTSSGGTEHMPNAGGAEEAPSPLWGPVVCFRLQTQLQPYLHGVLMHLITSQLASSTPLANTATPPPQPPGAEMVQSAVRVSAAAAAAATSTAPSLVEFAFQLANACRTHSYFHVSLELLLHSALNPPTPAPALRSHSHSHGHGHKPHRDTVLRAAVSFLCQFPEFPDVVISVARKNDASSWGRLFAETGSPQQLFAQCMEQGKLRTASCYLIVIQRTAGIVAAREAAVIIVQRIVQEEGVGFSASVASSSCSVPDVPPTNGVHVPPSASPPIAAPSTGLLSAPSPAVPSLSASPSVTFRRRRKLSALEGELQRYIALTREMEEEERQQKAAAAASAAASVHHSSTLPLVNPARRSSIPRGQHAPASAILRASMLPPIVVDPRRPSASSLPANTQSPPDAAAPANATDADAGCVLC